MTQAHPEHPVRRTLRYLAPNLVTMASVVFAVLALQATIRGEMIWGAWWGLYSTLTDKLDGLVARLLRASSPIGVQLDSLADLLNYGMVPATIVYAFFTREKQFGWAQGLPHLLLSVLCCLYVACATLRLARFNVSRVNPAYFFGVPSTMAGAIVLAWFVTAGKYGDPSWTPGASYPGLYLLGHRRLDFLMPMLPYVMVFCGLAMVSTWRVPKLGHMRSKLANGYVVANLVVGYASGLFHQNPEFIVYGGIQYLLIAGYYHLFVLPREKPEPLFPA